MCSWPVSYTHLDVYKRQLGIPVNIQMPEGIWKIELRGECYMSEEDFEATNAKQEAAGKKLFANPRNCAAGTLRQSDPAVAKERNLKVFIFNVQSVNDGEDSSEFEMCIRDSSKTTVYALLCREGERRSDADA